MAPLLSKIDSNKLLCDIQNEETVISAKYGKDLLNISKVIGRKTKWPRFFGLPGRSNCSRVESAGVEKTDIWNWIWGPHMVGVEDLNVTLTCRG